MSSSGRTAGLVIAGLLFAACTDGSSAPDGQPDGPGVAGAETLSGRYELSNRFDLASSGALPGPIADAAHALSGLAEHPAQTMLDLAAAAHVPVLTTLLDVLPPALENALSGWIDQWVFAQLYRTVPAAEELAKLVDDVASLVTNFEIVSALELAPGDEAGNASAVHALTGLGFTVGSNRLFLPIPSVAADAVRATDISINAVHIEESSPTVEDGRLDLGAHGFGLPLGTLALQALNRLIADRFGVPNLKAALGLLIPCTDLAHGIARRCIGLACVGHETELAGVCYSALDLAAQQVENKLKALDLRVLNLASGEARMWDALVAGGARDGRIDRIDHGRWEVGFDWGKGAHPATASFIGHRIVETELK